MNYILVYNTILILYYSIIIVFSHKECIKVYIKIYRHTDIASLYILSIYMTSYIHVYLFSKYFININKVIYIYIYIYIYMRESNNGDPIVESNLIL